MAFPAPTPVENNIAAVLGGPADCGRNGEKDNRVTKDCCHHAQQDRGLNNVYFNEAEKRCMGRGGPWDNAVDFGEFTRCCESRGTVGHGETPDPVGDLAKVADVLGRDYKANGNRY
jgi:hypothetical protein